MCMWGALIVGWALSIGLGLLANAAAAQPSKLSAEHIKETFAGAILELDTPLGTKVPIRFSSSGLMAGEAGPLGSYLGADRDRGRWWVADDRLCMKWFRWFEAGTHCFDLQQDGEQIWWQEQSGKSGTARIAGRFEEKPTGTEVASAAKSHAVQQRRETITRSSEPQRAEASVAQESVSPRAAAHGAEGGGPDRVQSFVQAGALMASVAIPKPQPARPHPPPATPASRLAEAPPLPVRPSRRPALASERPSVEMEAATYRVTRVSSDDILNVRNGPSEYHMPVGFIEPNGRGISIVGACQGMWCPIRYGRVRGWVNSYYLAKEQASREVLAGAR